MPLDPNAPPVQTPPPGMGAPQTQSAPMPDQIAPQPTQAAPTPAQAQIAKNLKTGLGFHALMGTHTDYQQGPNGPVPVQQPNNAKQLFRSILSGAILGMAGGAQGSSQDAGSGWAGAARGAGAARQGQIQDQQRQQQAAQQQFENSQKAQSQATEEQLKKAQISMYNMQKLKDLQEIQGGDYTAHQRLVSDAKPVIESYQATGLTPVVENISEADHEQYLKDHPGSASLDWQPTGMTHYVDKDNRVNYQTQWSAYDPKGSVVVPSSMVNDWKDSGLLDMHPDLIPNLKKDANGQLTIPYSAMMSLNTENSRMKSDAKTKAADDFQTKKDAADLTHLAAQTAQERASAAASGNEGALRAFELKQERAGADAETALTKNDGDWTKLSPDQKVALQPMVQKSIDEARAGLSDPLLKEQLGDLEHPDIQKVAQDRATALQQQLDDAKSHSIFVPPTKTASPIAKTGDATIDKAVSVVSTMGATEAENAIQNSTSLTPDQKAAVLDQWKKNRDAQAQQTKQVIGGVAKAALGSLGIPTEINSSPKVAFDSGPNIGKAVPGLVQRGNIDVNHRPSITNSDGSRSSIYSFTIPVNKDGSPWKGEYQDAPAYALVPSISNGKFLTPDGKIPPLANKLDWHLSAEQRAEKKKQLSALEDAATKQYAKTREHLGIFDSDEYADRYAGETHAYTNDGTNKKVYTPSY